MEKFPPHENENTQVPFGDKLTVSKISEVHIGRDKLFEFEHNPDKIIRVESFSTLEKRYKDQIDPIDVAILGEVKFGQLSLSNPGASFNRSLSRFKIKQSSSSL